MLIGRLTLVMAGAATIAGMTALSAPALAQGSLQDQLAVCARIGKKSARIDCYDSIANASSQGAYTPSFGASSMRTPSAPPPPPGAPAPAGSAFGSENLPRAPRAETGSESINAAVVASKDNGLSMWQFALSDGAVWRMTERDVNFRPPAPNETVTIRKGALGGYLMDVDHQVAVRVERVR